MFNHKKIIKKKTNWSSKRNNHIIKNCIKHLKYLWVIFCLQNNSPQLYWYFWMSVIRETVIIAVNRLCCPDNSEPVVFNRCPILAHSLPASLQDWSQMYPYEHPISNLSVVLVFLCIKSMSVHALPSAGIVLSGAWLNTTLQLASKSNMKRG